MSSFINNTTTTGFGTASVGSADFTAHTSIKSSAVFAGSDGRFLPPGLQQNFVDMDDSDSSEDDDSSFSSVESDETVVSPELPSDEETDLSDHQIPIAFTGPAPDLLQRPDCSPKGGRALPPATGKSTQRIRWDKGSFTLPCGAQRDNGTADKQPTLVRPVPVAPLKALNLTVPTRRHIRSASLALRHDAALRNLQLKQEEREERKALKLDMGDEKLDILGFTSYPRSSGTALTRSVSQPQGRRSLPAHPKGLASEAPRVAAASDVVESEDGVASSSVQGQTRSSKDERLRVSAHLLRTLGSSQQQQQQSEPVGCVSGRSVSCHRRPPSLDEISFRIGGGCPDMLQCSRDGSGCSADVAHGSRAATRPSPFGGCIELGGVELYVTPPTPRMADHDPVLPGVMLLRSPGPAPMEVKQGRLAAPAFDIAPGRTRMVQDDQRIVEQLSRLVQQGGLLKPLGFGLLAQPVAAKTDQVVASASFCATPQRPRQARKSDGDDSDSDSDRENRQSGARPQRQQRSSSSSFPVEDTQRAFGRALTDRSNGQRGGDDDGRSSVVPLSGSPKFVAPGCRGYGQSGKGLPSTAPRTATVRRHAVLLSSQGEGRCGVEARASASTLTRSCSDAGQTSRADAGRTMLARLEQRRYSSIVVA